MKKTAQITIFIIIGILIVTAFGITLYIGSKMGQRIQTKQTTQKIEQIEIQPIQDYVTTCLKMATEEGLKLIGKQGGTIYTIQEGITEQTSDYLEYDDPEFGEIKIPLLIMPPTGNVGTIFYSEPPEYPYPGFPYVNGEYLFYGYYGMSRIPPLYKKTPTGENVTGSIQENLEVYIAKKTKECASWQTFEDKNYQITTGTPTASIIFAEKQEQFQGEQYISVELEWPIDITTPGKDKTQLKDFATRENIRLATVYFTAKQIIDADATDITYKPTSQGEFIITTMPKGEDSIIILKDTGSKIENKPYEFWIARKNRIPALWKIDTTGLEEAVLHVTPEGIGTEIIIEGNVLQLNDPCMDSYEIDLNASDPDENNIIYSTYPSEVTLDDVQSGQQFTITVFAEDNSTNDFDYQIIPVYAITICPQE